ncbi:MULTISPECIES: glycine cleavage system protein GcvH [Tepidanaerobacter]|uniref:Glycine cleavage system H protein n=1 Tax=Tepidanaerobacter syntrophicus TaxID=224999 RepID=A0A0U9HMV8_9FIRM|nr:MULTISPECIES: glycine cleavage system protein GcvH [Tepidanaerobacter]GAQ25423.1 glycine cleavage system H protein [Tepidanaerobacter syntrophicus]GLI20030.1 glycine cleavage system protein GcvH [Tepidanaerobacter syntrophicus]GLI50982.1 glycine cleavage system protein GcvH [Tepidanaerobacter syntrophicus]HHV82700.1 glycine cleavage system protein GcvH [Tepidanaerobacter syntrophicus]
MSNIPLTLKYTQDHEWIAVEGNHGKIGITDHAQEELGDIVYVELPEVGDKIIKGEPFGSVESVKAASDLMAPVSGTVVQVNESLDDSPELVNESPYDDGWMIVVEVEDESELDDLLTPAEYKSLVEGE